ncbi:MAG: helix-turn-helix domain-containing protein, partial [Desulfohalobiaceae bacterium]
MSLAEDMPDKAAKHAPGFAILPAALVDAWPGLSPSAHAVAGALAGMMNGKTCECYPSRQTIADRAGLDKADTVTKATQELHRRGLL